MTLKELGLDHVDGYHITDLYDDYDYGIVTPDRRFKVDVNPSGSEWKTPDCARAHSTFTPHALQVTMSSKLLPHQLPTQNLTL